MNVGSGFGSLDFEITKRETQFEGFLKLDKCLIRHKLFQGGWSGSIERELLIRHEAAAIVLYDPVEDAVVLIEQFRMGAIDMKESPWMVELVAGLMDKDESPAELIKREAKEEADCDVWNISPIYQFFTSPGGSNEQLTLFIGQVDSTLATGVHGLASEGEDIKVHVVKAKKAFESIKIGKINNAVTIIGLQWLEINRQKLRETWL